MSFLRRMLRPRPDAGPGRPPLSGGASRAGGIGPWLRRFQREEWGVITVHNLFLLMTTACIGATAVDVTHVYAAREQLQVAADLGAHAAIVNFERGDTASRARRDAVKAIEYGMPRSAFGSVVDKPAEDIRFGIYNIRRDRFTALSAATLATPEGRARVNAALVVTEQSRKARNPVPTFLFRMVGMNQTDVAAAAVAISYSPGCLNNGFSAKKRVNITSNNQFFDDFCVHSNSHVEMNNNNGFELGTVVSMPDTSKLTMPPAGWDSNTGIREALREGQYDFRILERIRTGLDLQVKVRTMGTKEQRAYAPWLTSGTPQGLTQTITTTTTTGTGSNKVTTTTTSTVPLTSLPNSGISTANFSGPSGSVYDIKCGAGESLRLNGGTYSNMIITTNCDVILDGPVVLEQAIISTTSTSATSIKGNAGGGSSVQIGRLDRTCQSGGEAILLTLGGLSVPSKLSMFGGQILALGDISFTADFESYGASIITEGEIYGRTDINAHGCPVRGMEGVIKAPYFRLAR